VQKKNNSPNLETHGEGSHAIVAGRDVYVGMSRKEHESILRQAVSDKTIELKKEFKNKSTIKEQRIIILQAELRELNTQLNNLSESLEEKEKTLALVSGELETRKRETGEVRYQQAEEAILDGNTDIAASLFLEQLELSESRLLKEQEKAANSAFMLAKIHATQFDFRKAIYFVEKAIEHSPQNLTYVGYAADFYSKIGNYQKTLSYNLSRLKLQISEGADEHSIAKTKHKLANTYNGLLKPKEALPLLNQARDIFFPDALKTPLSGILYNSYGMAYLHLGDHKNAQKYFRKAIKFDKKNLGEDHPNVAIRYNNMGLVFQNKKIYRKAISWFEKALAIGLDKLDPRDESIAIRKINIGVCYIELKDYNNAEIIFDELIESESQLFVNLPSELANVYRISGIALYNNAYSGNRTKDEQRLEKSSEYLKLAIDMIRDSGNDTLNLTQTLSFMVCCLRARKMPEAAMPYAKEWLDLASKKDKPILPEVGIANYNLGGLYLDLEDWEPAVRHISFAYKIISSLPGDQQGLAKTIANSLKKAKAGFGTNKLNP